ncbi:MAG: hypothetical protein ACR2Q4_22300 [Geminicoccaceae bacterium]
MMLSLLPRLAAVALVVLSILAVSMQLGSADINVADRKLEAFIDAALAVDDVMDKWQPKIIRAGDSDAAEALHTKANAEIRETIEHADGISFSEYQDIRHAIAADSDMLARVTEIMWRKQAK